MRSELTKFDYILAMCLCVLYVVMTTREVVRGGYVWASLFGLVATGLAILLVLSFLYPISDDDEIVQEPPTAEQARTRTVQSYWSPEVDGTWVLYRNGQRVRCYTCGRDVYFSQPSTSEQIECKCGGPTLIIPNQPDHTS